MTNIDLINSGDKYTFSCKGHAENSIVCSAISALCCTLACVLSNEDCVNITKIELKKGSTDIAFTVMYDKEKVLTILDTVATGLKMIAKKYQNSAKINYEYV